MSLKSYIKDLYIIEFDGKDVGFYNDEILEDGTYEVGNICIVPEYQGNGIGSYILKGILEKNNDRDIKLQFFKQNPVGVLYERLGFEKSGETEFHYQMIKKRTK